MSQSVSSLLRNLCDHFLLIYDAWDEKRSDALAKKMLEEDVTRLGLFLGSTDEFGQLAELTLVAECVAYIRTFDSGIDQSRAVDYWTDIALEELQHYLLKPRHKESVQDIVEQLQTWAVACELYDLGRISGDSAASFAKHYLELADMFFMRDGNITSQKMTLMRELESALILS